MKKNIMTAIGKTPYDKLKSIMPDVKKDLYIFPSFILDKVIPIYKHIPFGKKDKKIKMGGLVCSAPQKYQQGGNILYMFSTT